jgi:signal transduction histidine kinase
VRSLCWILRVRSRELLARAAAPVGWAMFTVSQLESDFDEWLRSLEENSRGAYRLVCNLALQEPDDYYIDLKFAGARGSTLLMPPIFKDVIRDLIANARKYTRPGGQILAALHSGPDGLRLVVQDNGRGIPADELPAVVEGGRRGSNVADVRTMGGGFGLTKAVLVTRQFRGRLWIKSEEGRGTRVRIWLPPPPAGDFPGSNGAD